MSHEIDMTTGMAAFAYTGRKGWHGLGQEWLPGDSLQVRAQKAGMAWTIESSPVMYQTPDGLRAMLDRVVLNRSDNRAPLGVVSDSYKPLQPIDVIRFFDEIATSNGFALDTGGCLFDGKRFFATASIGPDAYVADPKDRIKGHLLLVTSADGTLATEGRFVATRVVCNNTLTMARGERGGTRAKISHRSVFRPGDMRAKLGIEGPSLFESTMEEFRKLARTAMTGHDMVRATIQALRPDTYDANGDLAVDADKLEKITRSAPVQRVAELAISGNGLIGGDMAGMRGTAWGWENALTQYVDHEARVQAGSDARKAENRFSSAMFGDGADIKQRAHALALAHAGTVGQSLPIGPTSPVSGPLMAQDGDTRAVGTMDGSDLMAGLLARPLASFS